jgi:outer membrane lipoprotein carrier protein
MKKIFLFLVAINLLGSLPALAGNLEKVLEVMSQRQSKIENFQASFTQEKILELLEEKLISHGKIRYRKPDSMSWEYYPPDSFRMIIEGPRMWFYYPDMKVAEKYDLERSQQPLGIFVGFGKSPDYLKENYQMRLLDENKTFHSLELIPRKEEESKYIAKVILWIDSKEYWPTKTQIFEPNGDTTLIEFRDIEINTEIPDSEFEFKVPEGVEVVEPLKN